MPHPQTSRHGTRTSASTSAMTLTSPAFADGATVPVKYTADGEDISPPLAWKGGPPGTVSFALVCEDPDAPSGLFVHWLVWNIDAHEVELRAALPDRPAASELRQGENSFGRLGWAGPSPPRGRPHRYVFRLYALDAKVELREGARRAAFDRAVLPHVLAEATLVGRYGR